MHYMGLLDLEQRAEAEARAGSVAAHIRNGTCITPPCLALSPIADTFGWWQA